MPFEGSVDPVVGGGVKLVRGGVELVGVGDIPAVGGGGESVVGGDIDSLSEETLVLSMKEALNLQKGMLNLYE